MLFERVFRWQAKKTYVCFLNEVLTADHATLILVS